MSIFIIPSSKEKELITAGVIICFENVIQSFFVFFFHGGGDFTVNLSRSLGGKHCHISLLGFIRKKYEMCFVDFSIFSSEPTQMANKTTNRCQQFKVTRNQKKWEQHSHSTRGCYQLQHGGVLFLWREVSFQRDNERTVIVFYCSSRI